MPLTPINHWSLVSGNIFYLLFIFKYCFILYIYTDICFRFFWGWGVLSVVKDYDYVDDTE